MSGYAKAIVAALASGLTTLLGEWTTEANDALSTRDLVVGLAAAVITFSAVFITPNKP